MLQGGIGGGIYCSESVLGGLRDRLNWGLVVLGGRGEEEFNQDCVAALLLSKGLGKATIKTLLGPDRQKSFRGLVGIIYKLTDVLHAD